MLHRSAFLSAAAVVTVYGGTVLSYPFASENVAPITLGKGMPGNLDSSKVPLLINLGFDDNKYADGVDWVRDTLLAGRFNNKGKGNPATYDGTPMKANFYVIGNSDIPWSETPHAYTVPEKRPVTDAWRRAYDAGMSIGNHTWTHSYNLSDLAYDQPKNELPSLKTELGMCHQYLINIAGIPVEHIYGFRTPYLASSVTNNDSYKVTKELGMIYDCTNDNQMQGNIPADWAYPAWPGTMDKGWLFATIATPGLWQVPNAIYQVVEGSTFSDKGFDSGPKGWPGGASTDAFLKQMQSAIKWAYGKNRASLDLGLHSDYYSAKAQNTAETAASKFSTKLADRRAALIKLLDWIESDLPDARVVTGIDVVQWMRNPTALDDLSRKSELVFAEGTSVVKLTNPSEDKSADSKVSISGNKAAVTVTDKTGDWKIDGHAGMRWGFSGGLEGVHGIRVTYSSTMPLRLNLIQSDITSGFYGAGLPSTLGKTKTVEFPISLNYFEPPRPYTTETPLDLSKVTAVSLVGQVMDTTMDGEFEAQVEIFGGTLIPVGTAPAKQLHAPKVTAANFSAQGVTLSVPQNGDYSVELFTASGRTLYRGTVRLGSEPSAVQWNSELASGIYALKITGSGASFTTRQAVIK